MCDYSLENIRSRPAQVGEKYKTTRFPSTSIGFASLGDCETAVCVQADTRLRLQDIPENLQQEHGLGPEEEVTFVRLDQGPYHDGVRIENGVEVTLQALKVGVTATITRSLEQSAEELALAEVR